MAIYFIICGLILAYFIGSIATSIWLGRLLKGIDVREHGSGNAGATNTFRVLGKKAGIAVMILDVAKGYAATSLSFLAEDFGVFMNSDTLVWTQILFGLGAVMGHIFPIYEGFRGGKGVATLLGMVLAMNYIVALICVVIFIAVFLISKYVSLGSMIAALAFPLLMFIPRFNPEYPTPVMVGLGFCIFLIVIFTHQKNIRRLMNGEENKANLRIRRRETN